MNYYSILAIVGILLNTWMYIDDIRNRDSVLDKVDRGGKEDDALRSSLAERLETVNEHERSTMKD